MNLRRWRVKFCNIWNDRSVTTLWRIISLLMLVLLVANLRLMTKSPNVESDASRKKRSDILNSKGSHGGRKLKGVKCEPVRLKNPSFEKGKDGWEAAGKEGYTVVSQSKYSGKKAIKITNGSAKQGVHFPLGVRKFVFSAYSRNIGVIRGKMKKDYSIWCDVKSDGDWTYGYHTKFMMKSVGGSYNWHEKQLKVQMKKDISEVVCSLIFRNYGSGSAYFDNVRMWIFPQDVGFEDCKYTYLM